MAGTGARGLAYRLPSDVRPVHYRLALSLDPARSRSYRGSVEIDVDVGSDRRDLVLHAADLTVTKAEVVGDGAAQTAKMQLRPASETLRLSGLRIKRGRCRLRLSFRGRLRDDLRGLYRVHRDGETYAFTQLQATDARRFFPCFDEPAFKARFAISVTTATDHAVVSNTPEASTEAAPRGQRTVHFEPTPPLSTYLLALAVGPLEVSRPLMAAGTPIRVWHARGKRAMTRFALNTAAACLGRLEHYFDEPYPYGKLDLVAVPDFEIGAMENAGAVFFRETLLLVDEPRTSLPERKRAAEVICHELAHMWFGNLVTMAWWDDLWLNEAFATWIAFAIVDGWQPDWQMWNDFAQGRGAALDLDALSHTHAIYTAVRTPAEATENFDLITYEKGAAVVRMLEGFLGERTFRAGVRAYIKAHREENAVAADLWRALSRAAGQANLPGARSLSTMMRDWITLEGHPVVRLEPTEADSGTQLQLTQTRFLAAGPPTRRRSTRRKGTQQRAARPVRWRIPVVLKPLGNEAPVRHLLTTGSGRVATRPGELYYGNADQSGCFRVQHDAATLAALCTQLDALSVPERTGLVGDTWSLTHAGYAPARPLMALLLAFRDEAHPDVLGVVTQVLDRLLGAAGAVDQQAHGELLEAVRGAFEPQLQQIGVRGRRGDTEADTLRRAALLDLLGRVAGSPQARAAAETLCDRLLARPRSIAPNLAGPVLSVAAIEGDLRRFDRVTALCQAEDTPQGQRRARLALADFRDPRAVKRLHALCLTPTIPTQDVALVLARQLENPAAQDATWAFIRGRWPRLRKRLTPMLITRVIGALSGLDPNQEREVARFFADHPVPTAKRAVQQVRERLRLERAFRARLKRELGDAAGPP